MKYNKVAIIVTLFVVSVLVSAFFFEIPSFLNHQGNNSRHPAIGNPAAVYCEEMGYEYTLSQDAAEGKSVCKLPDGETCGAWEFLEGTCGQEHSYCAKQGYRVETRSDGQNPFSQTYAVCVNDKGKDVGPMDELFQLDQKVVACQGESTSADLTDDLREKEGQKYVPTEDGDPPSSFDWRDYQSSDWLTPIKDQGGCGSCWAFSAVGVAEAAHNIAADNPGLDLDLSEQYLVADCFPHDCCGGSASMALSYIRDNGIPDEGCMSYVDGTGCSCGDGSCSTCTYNTDGACSDTTCGDRCGDWESRLEDISLTGWVGTNSTDIKQALVDKGPLAVSIGVGADYGGYFDGDIYRCTNDEGVNHAVSIVGYDDAGEYWILRNSWGTGYQDNGYFKLGYGECSVEEYVYYADASEVPAPENDDMADAYTVGSLPYTNTQSTLGATTEADEPAYYCGYNNSASVWYEFSPSSDGFYEVDTLGSDYDTVLHVFEDQGGSYLDVSCNDDEDISDTFQSRGIFEGQAGETYLIGITVYGDGSGGNLNFALDSYDCPADSLCTVATQHDGSMIPYPSIALFGENGNWVDSGYSSMGGYVEITDAPTGTYQAITTGEGAFIAEEGISVPGVYHASAAGLAPVQVVAKDKDGNPIEASVYVSTEETTAYVGRTYPSAPLTVYVTPDTYGVDIAGWSDSHMLSKENQVIGPGGGTLTLDASQMPLDILTMDWEGFTQGYLYVPGSSWSYGFWVEEGSQVYVSNPDHDYDLNTEGVIYDGNQDWSYYFLDSCRVANSGGQSVTCQTGGTLSTTLSAPQAPHTHGETGRLSTYVEDSFGNWLIDLYYYDYSSSTDVKDHSKMEEPRLGAGFNPGEEVVVTEDGVLNKEQPAIGDASTMNEVVPDYQVTDPLGSDFPGYFEYGGWLSEPYLFDLPDPAPLGTWQGEVTVDYGPYQADGTDTVEFLVRNEAQVADFDGDGSTDVSVYRPSNGNWYIMGQGSQSWGQSGDLPVPGDYDGDGTVDIAVYRPSNGNWYVKGQGFFSWGFENDVPMPCDYDGDGADEIGVYRPSNGNWYIMGQSFTSWGHPGDIPVPADYDGDGSCDIGVYRPSNGNWYIMGQGFQSWGFEEDIPVPGDYDGDGAAEKAVYRPSNRRWYIMGEGNFLYGRADDIPVPGDYDGDGALDLAVLRPSNGKWYVSGLDNYTWYIAGDYPLPVRDTDADGTPHQ